MSESTTKQLDPNSRQVIPLAQWESYHAWPTVSGMRNIVKHRHTNGLDRHKAVLRHGRKILIDRDRFFAWLEAANGFSASA